jgi:hypothetical protein
MLPDIFSNHHLSSFVLCPKVLAHLAASVPRTLLTFVSGRVMKKASSGGT